MDALRTQQLGDMFDQDSAEFLEQVPRNLFDVRNQLSLSEREIEAFSKVFGSSFNANAAHVQRLRSAIEGLIRAGVDPLGDEIRELSTELNERLELQKFENVFNRLADSVDRGLSDTVRGIAEGSQTLEEGMKNLARNMMLSFQEELLRLTVINPVINALQQAMSITGPQRDTFNLLGLFGSRAPQGPEQLGGPPPEDQMSDMWSQIMNAMQLGMNQLSSLGTSGFTELFGSLGTSISGGLNGLMGMASGLLSQLGSLFGAGFEAIAPLFSFLALEKGGLVPGSTRGQVLGIPHFSSGGLAMLHSGEFVLQAPSVRKMGLANAQRLNETGTLPNTGGPNVGVEVIVDDSKPDDTMSL